MRRAFTMVELIMTIVIMGILAGGAYISLAALYTKSAKSKAISELSFDSTLISSQISALLSHRVPSTVIGYDSDSFTFESIYSLSDDYTVFEWIGTDFDSYMAGEFSSFIDFAKSNRDANMLFSPNTKMHEVNSTALIFAGAYDDGSVVYGADFNDSFGWHENNHSLIFDINESSSNENITLLKKPSKIYEKYYLLKSAFAIARYEDINQSADCILDLNVTVGDKTLFLFYDYYPWKGKTFCADKRGDINGSATILSNEVKGFEVDFVNGNLQFNLTLEREIRKKGKNLKIQISKNKVVF
jgi:prepilin-type N-terminal cleavage/methylation domain-containing protein